ncbi:MAG: transporter substrate-binding domain-containing protein, partial [Proteobacteria bacterium]|nr:transporter substrate-binding domain-containing protein [Pseudomonadota bacterium]
MQLVKQSTLEQILQRGELRVGFEAGYMPFEMTDKNGNFVGFDIDIAKE